MTLLSGTASTYEGQYTILANQNTSGTPDVYTIGVRATDVLGNAAPAVAAGNVTVAAPPSGPPSAPVFP